MSASMFLNLNYLKSSRPLLFMCPNAVIPTPAQVSENLMLELIGLLKGSQDL